LKNINKEKMIIEKRQQKYATFINETMVISTFLKKEVRLCKVGGNSS